eukprot:Pgem_evm2s6724
MKQPFKQSLLSILVLCSIFVFVSCEILSDLTELAKLADKERKTTTLKSVNLVLIDKSVKKSRENHTDIAYNEKIIHDVAEHINDAI